MVRGPSGAGKTVLVETVLSELAPQGTVIGRGKYAEGDATSGFAPILQALSQAVSGALDLLYDPVAGAESLRKMLGDQLSLLESAGFGPIDVLTSPQRIPVPAAPRRRRQSTHHRRHRAADPLALRIRHAGHSVHRRLATRPAGGASAGNHRHPRSVAAALQGDLRRAKRRNRNPSARGARMPKSSTRAARSGRPDRPAWRCDWRSCRRRRHRRLAGWKLQRTAVRSVGSRARADRTRRQ